MCATWMVIGPAICNRDGSAVRTVVRATGLSFEPSLQDSEADASDVTSIVGWRSNEATDELFIRQDDVDESPRPNAVITTIASTQPSPGIWDADVEVAIRLAPRGHIAINADARPVGSGDTPIYLREFSQEGVAGQVNSFLTLKRSGFSPEPSDQIVFDASDPTDPIWEGMDLTAAAVNIGKLPKWDAVPTPLEFHFDAQAERASLSLVDTATITGLATWHNLRPGGANLTAGSSNRPQLQVTQARAIPFIRYIASENDRLEMASPGFDVGSTNATFGVVARAVENIVTESPAHLIGRWDGTDESTQQWRMVFVPDVINGHKVFVQFSWVVSYVEVGADVGEFVEPTMVIYRSGNESGGSAPYEIWMNGRLATNGAIAIASNANATGPMTVGARHNGTAWVDKLDTDVSPFRPGTVDQAFLYTERISDGALSLVMHEMSRRAGIGLCKPVLPEHQTQPYGAGSERPLERRPIALINLFGGNNYGENGNPLGQRKDWRDGTQAEIEAWLKLRVAEILNASDEFEIMFNRPAGQYRDDIVSSGFFGSMDVDPFDPIITTTQWDALKAVWTTFHLTHYNDRGPEYLPSDPEYARRAWFYVGAGITVDDDGGTLQTARMGDRIVAPCSATYYKSDFLDEWSSADVGEYRFRCLFLDSAVRFDGKFVEMLHDTTISDGFTLVGESITTDPDARKGAPWFALAGLPSAPWWNISATTGRPNRNNGYNPDWIAGSWDETPIYFGITGGGYLDLSNTTTNPGVGEGENTANLRIEDIYSFIQKGATPVAWDGQYTKIGAAWDYATGRIPVGRYPMMSPRISRVWR